MICFKNPPNNKRLPTVVGAYGMAEGHAAETDPVNGWTIHQGRLYLNWDSEITTDWRADMANKLKASEANWPTVNAELNRGDATVYWHD